MMRSISIIKIIYILKVKVEYENKISLTDQIIIKLRLSLINESDQFNM